MRRRVAALAVAVAALAAVVVVLASSGGGGAAPARQGLGDGPQRVTIFRPAGEPSGVVVGLLHGWGAVDPEAYRPWIDHLLGRGHVVVYPRYQDSFVSLPAHALPDLLAGLQSAFAQLDTEDLVLAGHSAGGALAADYAALAPAAGLPVPDAIMLAYPGRSTPRLPARLPELGDERIPPSVEILALASRRDRAVGTETARDVVRDAGHGSLVYVAEPGATDHLAPMRAGPAERRVFWRGLDRLIERAT